MKLRNRFVWTTFALLGGFVHAACADSFQWNGGIGQWAILSNWLDLNNPDGSMPPDYAALSLPGGSDNVTIYSGGATLGSPAAIGSLYVQAGAYVTVSGGSLAVLSNGPFLSGTLNLSGGTLAAQGEFIPGGNGGTTGVINQTGGVNAVGSVLALGNTINTAGTYNLTDGILSAPEELVYSSSSSFNQFGGTNNVGNLEVTENATYQMKNGVLNVTEYFAVDHGVLSGGTITVSSVNAFSPFACGNFTISGGTLIFNGNGNFNQVEMVDGSGGINAILSQTAGTNILNDTGSLVIGYYSGNSGVYNMSGGYLILSAELGLGLDGNGILNQSGGVINVFSTNGYLVIGGSGGSGIYTLSGNASLNVSHEIVSSGGAATFNQTGGIHTVTNTLTVGNYAQGTGAYNLSSGTLQVGGEEIIGGGTGIFHQTGGTHDVDYLFDASNYIMSGGVLNVTNGGLVDVGASFNLSGGTFNYLSSVGFEIYGTFNLSNGTLGAATEAIGPGSFNQAGGANNVGTLYVGPGAYAINGGALNVTNSLDIFPGGTLTGSGTVNGVVANSGIVTPGNPLGTLTITGGYSQSASGSLNILIGGTNAGSQYDQLAVLGAASLNGTLNVSFVNGFIPRVGDEFTIVNCQALTGNFVTVIGTMPAKGLALVPIYSGAAVTLVVTSPSLTVVDANPMFLSRLQLPQPITQTLLYSLAGAWTTPRSIAAADGLTKLLLQFTNNVPGTVVFSQNGASGGSLTAVDGSTLPTSGLHTIAVAGQQMVFALYTVPDQVDTGTVNFLATFTNDGGSTPINANPKSIQLIQTPVELVHGLGGDRLSWESLQSVLTQDGIPNHPAGYHDTLQAAGPFSAYRFVVNNDVQTKLWLMRLQGIAVTRADVVAHSMGGILTRIAANDRDSYRPDNFTNGYIRRVITVDTPHWGSCAAPVLTLLASDVSAVNQKLIANGNPVLPQLGQSLSAVQDLSPYSFATSLGVQNNPALAPLTLPSFAIYSYIAQDSDFNQDPDLTQVYFGLEWYAAPFHFPPQNLTSGLQTLLCRNTLSFGESKYMEAWKIFLNQPNDGVVSVDSQTGGCSYTEPFSGVEHNSALSNAAIQNAIIRLLRGPVSAFSSGFAGGFPAVTPRDLNTQKCPTAVPTGLTQVTVRPLFLTRLINLTSPLNGSTAAPGSSLAIVANPLTNATLVSVDFFASGSNPALSQHFVWDSLTNAPFTDIITVPATYLGPLTITAIAVDYEGNYDSEQCTIQVLPGTNLTLQSISVNLNTMGANLVFSQLSVPQSLFVNGLYSDGVTRDITLAGAGTIYRTSDPGVAVVDTNGNVSATGNGSAQITVTNAGLSIQMPVQVNLQPPQIMSIQPKRVFVGGTNLTLNIAGMNLGGSSNLMFLRNGQPDAHFILGPLTIGVNAASIEVPMKVARTTLSGVFTIVVATPVGNSGMSAQQGNQFSVVVSPVQGFTNVYGFTSPFYNSGLGASTNRDGFSPRAGLIMSGNTLFGTAAEGGSTGNGTVFSVNTNGTGFTNLYSFAAGTGLYPTTTNSDGAYPAASLVLASNVLFGTAESGGSAGNGTIFRVNADGTGFTNLHNFTALAGSLATNSDGASPQCGLALSGNLLYGTAEYGGNYGAGNVFRINVDGTGFTNLYSFTGGNDGAYPVASLVLSGNMLYGTTYEGGNSDAGTVFGVNTSGASFTTLYNFTNGTDGAGPQAGLILSGNILYSTTSQGGSFGDGTVFAVNSDGSGFTNLYNFSGYPGDGANPVSGLRLSGSTLYGTAQFGGNSNDGIVFAMNTNGADYIILHNFAGYAGDGALPAAGVVLSGNTLYGTTESGGSSDYGAIFSLLLAPTSPPQLSILSSGGNVILTWPADGSVFTLQSTTNLFSPAVWTTVSPSPVVVNGENTVTNFISGSQMFYRLSQ